MLAERQVVNAGFTDKPTLDRRGDATVEQTIEHVSEGVARARARPRLNQTIPPIALKPGTLMSIIHNASEVGGYVVATKDGTLGDLVDKTDGPGAVPENGLQPTGEGLRPQERPRDKLSDDAVKKHRQHQGT